MGMLPRPLMVMATPPTKGFEKRFDRRLLGGLPRDVPAEGAEPAAHLGPVGLTLFHDADRGEGPQPVFAAERLGRRIEHDLVARLDAAERRRLAVPDLDEPLASAEPDVLGRSDGNPVLTHRRATPHKRPTVAVGSFVYSILPGFVRRGRSEARDAGFRI